MKKTICLHVLTGLSLLCLMSPVPIAAQGTVQHPPIRWVDLDGTRNTREVGGYLLGENRQMRRGVLYRSDALIPLTEADFTTLQSLDIHTIIDLRTVWETVTYPDHAGLQTRFHWINIPMEIPSLTAENGHLMYYEITGVNAASFRKAFEEIARTENWPILYHCQRGVDRTGITTALILLLLGLDPETVREDYYLSVEAFIGSRDGICACWIDTFLERIELEGGVENYLNNRGIEPALQEALKTNLSEDVVTSVSNWMVHGE